MRRIRYSRKNALIVVTLLAGVFLTYSLIPKDRIAVIGGRGFRIPAEYPGSTYGKVSNPLNAFATAVLWPGMEPWTREAIAGDPLDLCHTLQIFVGPADFSKFSTQESQFRYQIEHNVGAKLSREGSRFGLERWVVVPGAGKVRSHEEFYMNRANSGADFISDCEGFAVGMFPQCHSTYVNAGDIIVGINHPIACLEHWSEIRGKADALLRKFEALYAERH